MRECRRFIGRFVPRRVRDACRYVLDPQYRTLLHESRFRDAQREKIRNVVSECMAGLWSSTGGNVASGIFKGMRYTQAAVGSAWAPKLLGTYELELGDVIIELVGRRPELIVDIGAAEGYYVVGLARHLRNARIVGFETLEAAHALMNEMAELNGVSDRIHIEGQCTPELLNRILLNAYSAAIVCDVEGAEFELLEPARVPALLAADILVEIHPWRYENLADILRGRFSATHDIVEIRGRTRTLSDVPSSVNLSTEQAYACMDETRPCPMSWLWMTVRDRDIA